MKKIITEDYINNYNTQKSKYFFTTFLSLSFIGIGLPLIVIAAMRDAYPHLNAISWITNIQVLLIGIEVSFLLLIAISYFLKERKKIISLLVFETTQWIFILVISSIVYFLIVLFLDNNFSKTMLSILYIFGLLKVLFDMKKKTSRQSQSEGLMNATEKFGGIAFLLIIVIRWISSFLFPNNENFSLIAILSPLFIVAALVFYTEYQLERIVHLKKIIRDQEKFRNESNLSVCNWYGKKSKESKEIESNN